LGKEADLSITINGLKKGEKPALVISECQRAMVDTSFADRELARIVEKRGMLGKIAALAQVFRDAGLPVIHATLVPPADVADFAVTCTLLANVRKRGDLRKGQPGADIAVELTPQPGDIVCERENGISGFHATELERILRSRNIQTVVLAGVSTNIALPTMAAEALNRLFNVVFPEDCTSGATEDSHVSQLALHLPLLGTISTSAAVADAVRAREWDRK
jgi:nicotinamidase-related amidase